MECGRSKIGRGVVNTNQLAHQQIERENLRHETFVSASFNPFK